MKISELKLSVRAYNCIEKLYKKDSGISKELNKIDVAYLCHKTKEQLLSVYNLGETTLEQIITELGRYDLKLNSSNDEIFINILKFECPCCGTRIINKLDNIRIEESTIAKRF